MFDGLTEFLGVGASVASGGLFGLLGAVSGVAAKVYQKKQELDEKRLDNAHELALIDRQMQARQAETEQEIQIADVQGSWKGIDASHQSFAAGLDSAPPVVLGIIKLYRPILTTILQLEAAWIMYLILSGVLDQHLVMEDVSGLVRYMVYTIFFTASTAAVWWYGDRAMTPPHLKSL